MYESKRKMSLKETLGMVLWALLLLGLLFLRGNITDKAYPEHIIGLSGLIDVRHYLIAYIASTVFFAIISVAAFFFIWVFFDDNAFISDKSLISRVIAVFIAVLIGHFTFTGDKMNNLDIHADERHDSKNGIIKSISLLWDVNHDIRKEESRKLYYTDISVKKKEYKYYWGKKYREKDEDVVVKGNNIISQIGSKDGPTMEVIFLASGRSLKVELYKESGFIKSIAGLEDLSEFTFTEKDTEILKRIQK